MKPVGSFPCLITMLPPRCFNCGQCIGHLHTQMLAYNNQLRLSPYTPNREFFLQLGITRYCCIVILISTPLD